MLQDINTTIRLPAGKIIKPIPNGYDRNALIRRWNESDSINREVARHIQILEQQGESIWTSWGLREVLNVLSLCWWAVEHPEIETSWWSDDGDGGCVSIPIYSDYIEAICVEWHPKTVMDFFRYNHGRDGRTEEPTAILDDLRKATDPRQAASILIRVLSLNLSSFLYSHFISDYNDESVYLSGYDPF